LETKVIVRPLPKFVFATGPLSATTLEPLAMTFSIGDRRVGPGEPCFIIGEIAQAHDGSLGTAHAYIDAVAAAGADAVKFQTHIAAAESTPQESFRVKFSPQDATRFAYWKRIEFSAAQWRGLADHARDRGLVFLSTPFSLAAVDLLQGLELAAWKVGSGEISNLPLIERMAATGKPILLSSGMSPWEDLDQAVGAAAAGGAPVAIFQCTTAYPCPPEKVGLNVLAEVRQRYGCAVGLSDHSGQIFAPLTAVAFGANLLEVHAVFSRECFGPDVSASLTTGELKQLVEGVRFVESMLANPIDKEAQAAELGEMRRLFGKSVVAATDLMAGTRLTETDLALKKPGTGIPAAQIGRVIGKTLRHAVAADTLLAEGDLE
jgi:N-acetylneuraminate synthase